MDDTLYGVATIPIIIGLVQVVKGLGLNQKYAPLASIILGAIIGGIQFMNEPVKGIILGITYGLSAVGLYSSSKNTAEIINKP